MKKKFVIFLSPGTFVSEETTLSIESWDIPTALKMARDIKERHSSTPYGFYFKTVKVNDGRQIEIKRSNMYYLGGKIETIEDVRARNDPNEKVLLGNMECNGIKRVITNTNSWKFTAELRDTDVVLQWEKENAK